MHFHFWHDWDAVFSPSNYNWMEFTVISFSCEVERFTPTWEIQFALLGLHLALQGSWQGEGVERIKKELTAQTERLAKTNEVWGIFLGGYGSTYDLQGLFPTEDSARTQVTENLKKHGGQWALMSSNRHWVSLHGERLIWRISPIELDRWRTQVGDYDSANTQAEILCAWEQ